MDNQDNQGQSGQYFLKISETNIHSLNRILCWVVAKQEYNRKIINVNDNSIKAQRFV
jgi:hypothetical protein